MSLEKFAAWGTIVCAVCAPLALFFTAAVFFQWKPETFSHLGIMSIPIGTALIVLLLGVFPWVLVLLAHKHTPKILTKGQGKTRTSLLGQDMLTIDYAGYGRGFGEYYDGTEDLRKCVKDNRVSVRVENSLFSFPDPYENQPKNLFVIYSHGMKRGQQVKEPVPEHAWLELP